MSFVSLGFAGKLDSFSSDSSISATSGDMIPSCVSRVICSMLTFSISSNPVVSVES